MLRYSGLLWPRFEITCCFVFQHPFMTSQPENTQSLAELVAEVRAEVTIQVTDVDSLVSEVCFTV